mgnify:CR=1 FL=1
MTYFNKSVATSCLATSNIFGSPPKNLCHVSSGGCVWKHLIFNPTCQDVRGRSVVASRIRMPCQVLSKPTVVAMIPIARFCEMVSPFLSGLLQKFTPIEWTVTLQFFRMTGYEQTKSKGKGVFVRMYA